MIMRNAARTAWLRVWALGAACVLTLAPTPALAQTLNVSTICDGPDCGFDDLIELAVRLIDYLVLISVIVTAIVMAVAGFKLVANMGNPGAMNEAKRMMGKVVTGFVIILAAWLIIQALTSAFLQPSFVPQGMS